MACGQKSLNANYWHQNEKYLLRAVPACQSAKPCRPAWEWESPNCHTAKFVKSQHHVQNMSVISRVFVAHTHKGMGSCAQGPRQILHLPWRITMSWNTCRESSKEIKYPKVNQLPRFSVFYTSTLSKFLPSRSTAPACNQFEEEHDVRSELETWNLTHANSEIGHLTSDKQPEHCAK